MRPTAQQLLHGMWDVPEVSQTTEKRNYRKLSPAESLHKQGKLTLEQLQALNKFQRHMLGALGVNVSEGNGGEDPIEFPTTRHNSELQYVQKNVLASEFMVLTLYSQEHSQDVIGQMLSPIKEAKTARGYVLALLHSGTDRLIKLWGLTSGPG